jgi:hypothetical protein
MKEICYSYDLKVFSGFRAVVCYLKIKYNKVIKRVFVSDIR